MINPMDKKAKLSDLPRLIELFLEDELGQTRKSKSPEIDEK
jgi:hypothetical protein